MKKYAAFAYPQYYPSGGWGDFIGFVDSVEEGQALIGKDAYLDYLDLVSTETWKLAMEIHLKDRD